MVKIKKKEKCYLYNSHDGHQLKLSLEKNQTSLKISILNMYSIHKKSVGLFLIAVMNLFCLFFHILPIKIITAIFCFSFWILYQLWCIVTEEHLIIIQGLGIQVNVKYVMGSKSIFIPQEQVQKIFVNEVIFRNKVIYVLSLLIYEMNAKDSTVERIVPLFLETLPRLACLRVIYNNIKQMEMK